MKFLQVQLFITLISLPILTWWGLPLSLASPLGNLIFTPFLTLFLLLSSLIFFCELVYLPTGFLIILLESVTNIWLSICSLGSRSWLLALIKPSLITAFFIPLSACAIVHYKKALTLSKSVAVLCCFMLITLGYLQLGHYNSPLVSQIPCFKSNLTLLGKKPPYILIDPGVLGSRISACSYVTHTLIPELITSHAIAKIDAIICLKPSLMTFRAVAQLCRTLRIQKIYMPAWSGHVNNIEWRAWEELLARTKKNLIELILLEAQTTIALGNFQIILTPSKLTRKSRFIFREFEIFYSEVTQKSAPIAHN